VFSIISVIPLCHNELNELRNFSRDCSRSVRSRDDELRKSLDGFTLLGREERAGGFSGRS